MEKPLLALRPNMLNAVLPLFAKNLAISAFAGFILYAALFTLKSLNTLKYEDRTIITAVLALSAAFLVIPLAIRLVVLFNTKYYFFRTYLTSEFEFFSLQRNSVPYNKIARMEVKISVWDRLCSSGSIILTTTHEQAAPLILHYVKSPRKIENAIYHLLKNQYPKSQRTLSSSSLYLS